jgi:hypothetical protein
MIDLEQRDRSIDGVTTDFEILLSVAKQNLKISRMGLWACILGPS